VTRLVVATALALSLAMPSAVAAEEPLEPPSEICAADAGWADDNPDETARAFEEAFREFDWRFVAFSERLEKAVRADEGAAMSDLRAEIEAVYRALAHLLPLREAGNEAWPMKFLIEDIPGGVPLPDFDPPDREEVLRAAFLREMVSVALPGAERSKVRFWARLGMTRALLDADTVDATDLGALRVLAGGALAEAYEADVRRPALYILGDGWHPSLASRLRGQVRQMCREAVE
jgi:hypothetical protein